MVVIKQYNILLDRQQVYQKVGNRALGLRVYL